MTRNVTIRMDEALLRTLRHRAVDENLSLSRWIVSVLRDAVEGEAEREEARERALRRLDAGFCLGGRPLTREQMHAR